MFIVSQITNLQYANYLPLSGTAENTTLIQGFSRLIPEKECLFCAINPFDMKKQLAILLTSLCLALFIFPACRKDEDPKQKTKTELLTQSSWRFGAATVGGTDVSGFLQACQKDNTMIFLAAGTGTLNEGPMKCNGSDPQTTPFTWSFSSGETLLNISATLFTGGSNTFTIVALNETQLVLSQIITVGGSPQNVVVTFLH